eukprot:gene10615-10509_t
MPKKANGISVVPRFGGRRCPPPAIPPSCKTWGVWDCDPTKRKPPKQHHAYGAEFPWKFDMTEKAYILEGSATLTPDDPEKHGKAVTLNPGDMATFPRGWTGRWSVHSFLKKRYAFFDGKGLRVDEDEDEEEEDEEDADEDVGAEGEADGGTPGPAVKKVKTEEARAGVPVEFKIQEGKP